MDNANGKDIEARMRSIEEVVIRQQVILESVIPSAKEHQELRDRVLLLEADKEKVSTIEERVEEVEDDLEVMSKVQQSHKFKWGIVWGFLSLGVLPLLFIGIRKWW